MTNVDPNTVTSFGDEWSRFDQTSMSDHEVAKVFAEYFEVFPWGHLPENAEGFDMGCGSGRWARCVAGRVGRLHCIDPSEAIEVAKRNLVEYKNVSFHKASVGEVFAAPCSQDFGYSLGVLHHVPDTQAAIRSCVEVLKPGAPLLLYLYYAFDNRPFWFKALWQISDWCRKLIIRLPARVRHWVTDIIAGMVYWPISKLSQMLEMLGMSVSSIPLSYYRQHSFYTMRTDARDRFGTPLEHRFAREQIATMMKTEGLVNLRFSENAPYWCVVGFKLDRSRD